MFKKDLITSQHPFLQLLILVGLMVSLGFVISLMGVGLAMPIFNKNLTEISQISLNKDNANLLKWLQLWQGIGLFLIPGWLFLKFQNLSDSSIFNFKQSGSKYVMAVLLFIIVAPIVGWLYTKNQAMHLPSFMAGIEAWMRATEATAASGVELLTGGTSAMALMFNLIVVALVPAMGEELIFRGGVQNIFMRWIKNPHVAIIITGILFSAFHVQFLGFLPRAVMGIVLGYLYYYSGSLGMSIVAHFINNGIATVAAFLYQRGMVSEDVNNFSDFPLYSVIISSAATFGIIYWFKKQKEKASYMSFADKK